MSLYVYQSMVSTNHSIPGAIKPRTLVKYHSTKDDRLGWQRRRVFIYPIIMYHNGPEYQQEVKMGCRYDEEGARYTYFVRVVTLYLFNPR